MGKKVGNDEIWANFDHLQIYLRVAPTNLKPVLYTPFQGLLLGKVWTTPADLRAPNFNGYRPQILDQISKIAPISDLLGRGRVKRGSGKGGTR